MKTAKRYPTWHVWSRHWVLCHTLATWPRWWHMANDAAITYWVSEQHLITQSGHFVRKTLTCWMGCCLSCRLNFVDIFCVKKSDINMKYDIYWLLTFHTIVVEPVINARFTCKGERCVHFSSLEPIELSTKLRLVGIGIKVLNRVPLCCYYSNPCE